MPQKKNPDVAELARGKAGRLIGDLTGLLATLKGLPLAYDRDLQEDKEPVFDAVDQLLHLLLPAVTGLIATLAFDTERLESLRAGRASRWPPTSPSGWSARACRSAMAHEVAGACVRVCEERGIDLRRADRRRAAPRSTPQLTPEVRDGADRRRRRWRLAIAVGGTAPVRVAEQLAELRAAGRTSRRPGPAERPAVTVDRELAGAPGARASRRALLGARARLRRRR